MKLLLISLFLIISMSPSSKALRQSDTFEFGVNTGQIVFTTSGSMGLLEKLKRVSVVVPECVDLKYVRVDVNSLFGPPSVKFDWETNSVTLEFSPLQISSSQYTVSAKGIKRMFCDGNQLHAPQQQQQIEFVELVG